MQDQDLNISEKPTYWVIALFALLLLGALIWSLSGDKERELSPEESSEQVLIIPKVELETVNLTEDTNPSLDFAKQLPFYEQEAWQFEGEGESLPELADSDKAFSQDLLAVSPPMQPFLFSGDLIKKYTFSINDMAQGLRPPTRRLREISFNQPFSVTEKGKKIFISEHAYHRYDKLAQAINSIDKQGAVALYKKYLPLFQTVFAGFSYPDNYQLLDSIKAATGKIIQAPVINEEIEVIRPSVGYKFANPKLEKLSALDKQMLRMGPENTRLIQNKLRELIEALIAVEQE